MLLTPFPRRNARKLTRFFPFPCAYRTWFAVFGYADARQGVFSCRLEYQLANGTIVPAALPWAWYDGAHTNGARSSSVALCSAYALPYELYTLVVTVQPDQVYKGLGVRSESGPRLPSVTGRAVPTRWLIVRLCWKRLD